jgi:hypothetical protein
MVAFSNRRMRPKIIPTILWMIIFAAVTFCVIPITFVVIVFSHIGSDALLEYVLWPLRLIFVASPFVAFWLGLRGSLPGTRPLAVGNGSANTISRILTFTVILIVGLFALGARVAFLPPPGRPNISIAFLGYTNDTAGARLAKIAVTNLNSSTIFVYQPKIELQAPTDPSGHENYFSGVNCSWRSMLDRGASGSFTIPPPTNQSPWRLSFFVYPDRGRSAKNIIKNVVSLSCVSVGLWPLFEKVLPLDGAFRLPYSIEGDWIRNDK